MSDANRYLTAQQVRDRFGGISQMTLWRWLKDPELGFPRPMVINRRRLFGEDDIVAWELSRKQQQPKPTPFPQQPASAAV